MAEGNPLHSIEYHQVESAIQSLISENQKPTTDRIKKKLGLNGGKQYDEIIEYYAYMWEQRHTATYLDNIEPINPAEFQNKDLVKRALQLEESLAMMRATIEATEDCLLMINKEGKLIGLNKKLIDFVGLPQSVLTSKDETEGLNYLFGQIADPQELANLVMKKYQDPTPGSCGEMLFKDGRVVERYYQPQIVNGQVVGHVWSLRDVTERKKQEESLRLTNRAITASTHGIILIENSAHFPIIYYNPATIKLLQLDENYIAEKPFIQLLPEFDEYQFEIDAIFRKAKKGSITIQYHLKEKIMWLEINIDPVYERDQKIISHFVCIINDITKSKELENILQYKAVHDALTGLPNKLYLEDAIRYVIKSNSEKKEKFGLLFIDIDRFKNINDTLGHRVGDKLLRLFSKRMQSNLQKKDIVSRIGGDEFIILVHSVPSVETLEIIANRLLESCRKRFIYSDHEFNITASIGIVCYPECGTDPEALIRNADIAMYQAKQTGRNRACLYTTTLDHNVSRRVLIENAMHDAIKNNEFELYYQPIFSMKEKKFNKVEALIRWNNKKLGPISPGEFIPIAEDIGMMTSIGRWVLETAAAQMAEWNKAGLTDLIMSVNVSAKQLLDEKFVHHIKRTIYHNELMSHKLILEITESFFLLDEKVGVRLNELTQLGVKIAIDDFGTGYSNLNYLNKLHISYLKIDKSFIDQIEQHQFNDSVLLAIIAIAKRMQFTVIAEGVETENQYHFLLKNECDEIQGYYFSKPLPKDRVKPFLDNK